MAAPSLAKSAGCNGPGGCPDLRRFAVHSGGTVADSHGLPRIPNLLDVDWQSMWRGERCQHWSSRSSETPSANAALHTRAYFPSWRKVARGVGVD